MVYRNEDTSIIKTLFFVPRVSGLERFHCAQGNMRLRTSSIPLIVPSCVIVVIAAGDTTRSQAPVCQYPIAVDIGTDRQWNLSNPDTLGTKKSVLIMEVSAFQGL